VRIHFAAEHAAKLQLPYACLELRDFLFDVGHRCRIVFGLGKFEQLAGIRQRGARRIELVQIGAQPRPLAPQLLRPCRIAPDILLLELTDNLFQALLLGVVVKETPEGRRCAPPGRAGSS